MGATHRLQTKVRPAQAERVAAYAQAHLLTTSAALRVLLARALEEDPLRTTEQVALASLVAAEHAVLIVGALFPEGDERPRRLAEQALQAAERRLAQLADRLTAEARVGG